ncbi:transposable element Tcb2 transposase [Trichonephila clavipes]|nr:transposable element Tcb2 transposase [Trichonephila clavipes]
MPGKRARRHFSQLSEFERGLIIGMKTAGWLTRRVARQVDHSECAVRNCWEQWTREVTRSTIRADVGVAIVPQTVFRHLDEANLKSKRPFRALPLTPETSATTSTVVPSQINAECHRLTKAYDSRSTLIVIRGTLTGQRYVDHILRPHVGPFLNGLPEAIFQQDNARPHTAKVTQDFLGHFQTLPWPARSPDLSPVEHVWDQLKRQMPSCHSVHDLELAVQDFWAHPPQDNIRCLINSMPDPVVTCIAAGGGPTL